jgi:CheY-like chemotaxis protein
MFCGKDNFGPAWVVRMSILVVDDEELVRCAVSEFLETLGYRVVSATGGEQAIALVGDLSLNIQAVITDVNMPGMTGPEMWQRMKPLLAPACRVLFMSGRANTAAFAALLRENVLAKPFSFQALEEKLGQMIAHGTRKAVS